MNAAAGESTMRIWSIFFMSFSSDAVVSALQRDHEAHEIFTAGRRER